MTEKKIEKLNGKRVIFEMHAFPHSVERNIYEGIIHVTYDEVCTPRMGAFIKKKHVGFYLENEEKYAQYFDYRAIKLIIRLEVKQNDQSKRNDE